MKIVLFRDGRPGVAAKLPGEEPEVELSDLLGGETKMTPLNAKLILVTLKDAGELGLGERYTVHRIGREPAPVIGDCAVVAMRPDCSIRDVTIQEVDAALSYVRVTQ